MKKQKEIAKNGKVVGVPLSREQLRRFYDQMPEYVRGEAAWARQLIVERLEQIEKAAAGAS